METPETEEVLVGLGQHVRQARKEKGLTIRDLAERSRVSERFLSDVEAGRGNVSVAKLAGIARALGVEVSALLLGGVTEGESGARMKRVASALSRLSSDELEEVEAWVRGRFGKRGERAVVALLGLRGAGKSSVGEAVARKLGWPFVELDTAIEAEAGISLSEIFALHGEAYYRRLELAVLERILGQQQQAVIATGGGIVQSPEAMRLLEQRCVTVWLKASPAEHWDRVVQQGDIRPMKGKPQARAELDELWRRREPLYRRAQFVVETGKRDVGEVVDDVVRATRR